jgi:serine/threonine protein kinase
MSDNSDSPVTQRLSGGAADDVTQRMAPSTAAPATARFDGGEHDLAGARLKPVTARLQETAPLMAALHLQTGLQIADRYRVEAGPLGGISGEAEIYRCHDEQNGMEVAVKLYRHNTAPRQEVLKNLLGLVHPDIVSIKAYGSWSGRFYEVMEFCQGGSLADAMPFSEAQLRDHIPQIVNGLRYCHQQGIIHRDIKPNNLFFRDRARSESVLGDFGISSLLDADNSGVRVTHTAGNLTLDYAAPELLDGHKISPKTDYYSLGVTLLHLLTGHSPFRGMSNTDMLVAHLRGRIELPATLSPPLRQLLAGLLQVNPENRWGYRQVYAWLNNEPILRDNGTPWREAQAQASSSGYPGFPAARTPQELGRALHQFDATKQLFRGDIRRWIFDHHDPALAERIEQIEENYTQTPQLGLQKLRYLLDPSQPLRVADRDVHTLKELLDILLVDDANYSETVTQLLFGGILGAWVDTLDGVPRRDVLVSKIAQIADKLRYKDPSLALFALRYTLAPQQPLSLGGEAALTSPGDIETVLKRDPEAKHALAQCIADGRFEQWLRAGEFPRWEEDVKFLQRCNVIYAQQQALLLRALRWRYRPDLPIRFGSTAVSEPRELARLIERDEASRQLGLRLLADGWLRAWLVSTGRVADPDLLDQVLWDTRASEASKLEAILQLLDPTLQKPQLAVGFSRINFGPLDPESPRSKTITVRNATRGHLSADLKLEHPDRGFSLDKHHVEGNENSVRITAHALGMPAQTRQQTELTISSNGGEHRIELAYQVAEETPVRESVPFRVLARSFLQNLQPQHAVVLVMVILAILQLAFCHPPGRLPL